MAGELDIATLGIRIDYKDVQPASRSLDALAVSGDKAERSTEKLERGLEELITATRGVNSGVSSVNASLSQMIAREEAAAKAAAAAAEAQRRQAAAANAATAARRAQIQLGEQMAAAIDRERRMILLHTEALQMNATRTMAVGGAARSAGAGINGLREPLTSATRQLLSLNPAAAQVASVLGTMAIGAPLMIGILAGVAALSAAYRKLTESSRAAREEQEKWRNAAIQIDATANLGYGGEALRALEQAGREMLRVQQTIASLRNRIANPEDVVDPMTGAVVGKSSTVGLEADLKREIQELELWGRRRQRALDQVLENQREHYRKMAEESQRAIDQRIEDLGRLAQAEADAAAMMARLRAMGVQTTPRGVVPGIGSLGVQYAAPNMGFPTPQVAQLPSSSGGGMSAAQLLSLVNSFQSGGALGVLSSLGPITGGIAFGLKGIVDAINESRRAAEEFTRAVNDLRASITSFGDTRGGLEAQIRGVREQAEALRRATADTYGGAVGRGVAGADVAAEEAFRRINEAERERIQLLVEEESVIRRMTTQDLGVRGLRAGGLGSQADDLEFALRQERERLDVAKKYGEQSAEYASTVAIQMAEAAKRAMDIAASLDEAASDALLGRYRALTGASAPFQRVSGSADNQAWFDMFAAYLDNVEAQTRAAEETARLEAIQAQFAADNLRVAQESQRALESQVAATRQVFERLKEYRDSLALSNLSPLSAGARYNEARRQFDAVAMLAQGGDRSALASLPSAGNAFLEASRGMFASSTRYATDYNQVQGIVASLTAQFGQQLSIEEKMLAELEKQTALASASVAQDRMAQDRAMIQSALDAFNVGGFNAFDMQAFDQMFGAMFPGLRLRIDAQGSRAMIDSSQGLLRADAWNAFVNRNVVADPDPDSAASLATLIDIRDDIRLLADRIAAMGA